MATTTPKTRGNTKTTKSRTTKTSAAKTTPKVRTTKTTAKKAATKAKVAAKAPVKAVKTTGKTVSKDTKTTTKFAQKVVSPLKNLHVFTAVVSAALIAAAVAVMGKLSVPVTATYLVRDEVATHVSGTTVFAPAVRNIYDAQFRYLLIALLAVSFIFSVLLATRLQARVKRGLDAGVVGARWLENTIVVALMFEIAMLAGGVTDLLTTKVVIGLVALSGTLGYLAERQRSRRGTVVRTFALLSLLSFVLPILLLVLTLAMSGLFGMVRLPWYVYALYGTIVLSTAIGAVTLRRRLYRIGQWNNSLFAEQRFAVISLVMKVAFAVILIIGLQK